MTKDTIAASPLDIVMSLMERDSRLLHAYISNPPQNFSPEDLRKHLAKMYGYAESLVEMANEARAKAQAQADANGAAPADQVN